jgi:hypothetical protein
MKDNEQIKKNQKINKEQGIYDEPVEIRRADEIGQDSFGGHLAANSNDGGLQKRDGEGDVRAGATSMPWKGIFKGRSLREKSDPDLREREEERDGERGRERDGERRQREQTEREREREEKTMQVEEESERRGEREREGEMPGNLPG